MNAVFQYLVECKIKIIAFHYQAFLSFQISLTLDWSLLNRTLSKYILCKIVEEFLTLYWLCSDEFSKRERKSYPNHFLYSSLPGFNPF